MRYQSHLLPWQYINSCSKYSNNFERANKETDTTPWLFKTLGARIVLGFNILTNFP